ncbi:MAG: hypothetical protein JWM83_572 [Candidatus Angelobacter sp.]|jgi:hypothetical protein|nr:hypothetical protein [Candidatus Angelobacter sp.]
MQKIESGLPQSVRQLAQEVKMTPVARKIAETGSPAADLFT